MKKGKVEDIINILIRLRKLIVFFYFFKINLKDIYKEREKEINKIKFENIKYL